MSILQESNVANERVYTVEEVASLVEQLQKSPELAKTLAALISAQTGGKRK